MTRTCYVCDAPAKVIDSSRGIPRCVRHVIPPGKAVEQEPVRWQTKYIPSPNPCNEVPLEPFVPVQHAPGGRAFPDPVKGQDGQYRIGQYRVDQPLLPSGIEPRFSKVYKIDNVLLEDYVVDIPSGDDAFREFCLRLWERLRADLTKQIAKTSSVTPLVMYTDDPKDWCKG